MRDLKIITLYEPWATAIALNLKRFETRPTGTKYRGELAIHASVRPVDWNAVANIRLEGGDALNLPLDPAAYKLGCILTVVNLTDCLKMVDPDQEEHGDTLLDALAAVTTEKLTEPTIDINTVSPLELAVGNWEEERFAYQLEDNQPLSDPLPWRGLQGLCWIRHAPVLNAIRAQLRQVDHE